MFAKEQSDLLLIPSLQCCGQSAPRAASPLRHHRQALQHCLDNLRITTVERHSHKIASVLSLRFYVQIRTAREEQAKRLEIAVHRCNHKRRKTILVSKINQCTGINEAPRRIPILLRYCD